MTFRSTGGVEQNEVFLPNPKPSLPLPLITHSLPVPLQRCEDDNIKTLHCMSCVRGVGNHVDIEFCGSVKEGKTRVGCVAVNDQDSCRLGQLQSYRRPQKAGDTSKKTALSLPHFFSMFLPLKITVHGRSNHKSLLGLT